METHLPWQLIWMSIHPVTLSCDLHAIILTKYVPLVEVNQRSTLKWTKRSREKDVERCSHPVFIKEQLLDTKGSVF